MEVMDISTPTQIK